MGKEAIQAFGQREDALGELMREAQRQFNEAVKVINDDTTKRRTCYNGAQVTNPFDAFDQAAARIGEKYAQRQGVRGGGEEVYPGREPGAGSRTEKALIRPRPGEQGPRAPRKPARQEVSAEDLINTSLPVRRRASHFPQLLPRCFPRSHINWKRFASQA